VNKLRLLLPEGRFLDLNILDHNKLISLNPFLDKKNLSRVGSRLSNSSFSFEEKHPLILLRHRVRSDYRLGTQVMSSWKHSINVSLDSGF